MFCLNYSQTSLLSAFPSSSRVWQNSLARLYRRHKNSLSLLCSEMSDEVFFRNQWMQVGNSTPGHYLLLQKPERGIDPKQSLLLRKVNLLPAVPELVAAKGNKSWQLRVNNRIKMQVGETNILKTSLVILSGELLSAAWLKLDSKLTCSKNRCRKPIFVQLGFRGWCKSSSWWNCFHRNQSWQMNSLLYYASFCSVFVWNLLLSKAHRSSFSVEVCLPLQKSPCPSHQGNLHAHGLCRTVHLAPPCLPVTTSGQTGSGRGCCISPCPTVSGTSTPAWWVGQEPFLAEARSGCPGF